MNHSLSLSQSACRPQRANLDQRLASGQRLLHDLTVIVRRVLRRQTIETLMDRRVFEIADQLQESASTPLTREQLIASIASTLRDVSRQAAKIQPGTMRHNAPAGTTLAVDEGKPGVSR